MNNKYVITTITALLTVLLIYAGAKIFYPDTSSKSIKVGFVYIGDTVNAYTNNFYRAQTELEDAFPNNVTVIAKYNISKSVCAEAMEDLIKSGCSMIVSTSLDFGKTTKKVAEKHPDVQFCQATGDNANTAPVLPNYHTFMGTIYEGRYVSGVVAGMKLAELINKNKIKRSGAKVGYVAAFPIAEVISGYTAFFLGVRNIAPEAVMVVKYTNKWSSNIIERKCAEELIASGCVIISQHSDTTGPAIACEEASVKQGKTVFHVGYNQSMTDVAPTTSLISSRINWAPYIITAAEAVLKKKRIESLLNAKVFGNDATAGFEQGWIEMIGLNRLIVADGSIEEIEQIKKQFKSGNCSVFKGNYVGTNPNNADDVWDLRKEFKENESRSTPTFCYVLNDVIAEE